jgi:predicted AlkP superfamily phosphohydrolase/phosphomutase
MTDATGPRVVVVGFDAMDAGLARGLIDDGRMPVLAGLFDQSAWAPTRNPEGLVVGGVWPSFATARWPGNHGFYCYRQFVDGAYAVRRFTPYDIEPPALWQVLSEQGRHCCVVDAPLTRPVEAIDGVHVVDWGTHDRMLSPSAWPAAPGTAGSPPDLLATTGPHPVLGACDDYIRRGDHEGLRAALAQGAERKTDLNLELLSRGPWDLFFTVYSESHCAGHQFWGLHDPTWPAHDPALRARLGDPLEATYEVLDAQLGRMTAAIEPDDVLVVLMSHGVGAHHDGDHMFAEILRRLDDASGRPSPARRWAERGRRGLARAGREVARRRRPGDPELFGRVSVDGSRRFIPVPNNELYAAVRLNLAGREPRGRVRPGPDADRWCDWLEARLLELTDADTGRPLVRRVLRVDELFPGERRDRLPDLLVDWHRDAPITSAASPTIGEVRGRYEGIRSGDHRPGGLVLVRDPGVVPGPRDRLVDVVDLAPTIAGRLGVVLAGADGVPAVDLLPAAWPTVAGTTSR